MLKKIFLFSLLLPCLLKATAGFVEPWGKDKDLCFKEPLDGKKKENFSLTDIATSAIKFHQNVISPIDGPRSHFRPTSSRYMQLAIERYGFFKGVVMGCDRLLRENEEVWVYPTITIDKNKYKYDPAFCDKWQRSSSAIR